MALLLLLTLVGSVRENKDRVIAAVTKEENCITNQSTNYIMGESKEEYILLNKLKSEVKKEYLSGYFTYNENGLYVDGTDGIPLELINKEEGYISIGFQYNLSSQNILAQSDRYLDPWKVTELGPVKMTLIEEPVYWKLINEKGVYETSNRELSDPNISKFLPQTIDLKGYMVIEEGKNSDLYGKIDFVPITDNSTESNACINDNLHANTLLYQEKLYQYVMEGTQKPSKLLLTANYQFHITLPNNMELEGIITFTKNYIINKQ